MPTEPEDTSFPGRVTIEAYPVQELAGLIFAYLGPAPAPLLPRWDLFVCENVRRDIGFQVVPCNWLQMQRTTSDPGRVGWLHRNFSNYVLERWAGPDLQRWEAPLGARAALPRRAPAAGRQTHARSAVVQARNHECGARWGRVRPARP